MDHQTPVKRKRDTTIDLLSYYLDFSNIKTENDDDNTKNVPPPTDENNKCWFCKKTFKPKTSRDSKMGHIETFHSFLLDQLKLNQSAKSLSKERISNQIVDLIANQYLPLRFVECQEFRNLMCTLHPSLRLPNRKSISNLIHQKYICIIKKIRNDVKNKSNVSLIIDFWSSYLRSYLGVNIQYIDSNWCLKNTLYALRTMPNKHTSTNINDEILSVIGSLSLKNILCVISDNAPNMIKARRLVVENRSAKYGFGCYVHRLQSIIRKVVFVKHKNLFEFARSAARHFRNEHIGN